MKQIILALNIVFLCNFLTTAQKTISKKDFESLVDYANCKYVMAFIEKNDIGKAYFIDTYEKKVKPELGKATLSDFKTISNFQMLTNLLSNDNSLAYGLAKKIDRRKLGYDNFQDNESLINSLSTTGWNNIDLSQTAANIQNDIMSILGPSNNKNKNIKPVSEAEVVKAQTIQTSTQVEQLQAKFDELQQQNDKLSDDTTTTELQKSFKNFKRIVLGAFILLFVLLVVIFFILKKNLQKYKNKQVLESNKTEKKFVPEVVKPYNLTEKDINIIANKVLEQYLKIEKENQPKSTIKVTEPVETPKPVSKFLKGKSGRLFNRTESTADNSFFKLLNENDETAQFEFFGNEAEAIAKRIFSEDISIIISGNYQNAHSIKTDKPGKIKRVGEQWEVIEPIQIKLI